MNKDRLARMLLLLEEVDDLVYDTNYQDHIKDSLVSHIVDGTKQAREMIERVKDEENI